MFSLLRQPIKFLAIIFITASAAFAEESKNDVKTNSDALSTAEKVPLKAAIFIRNNGGKELVNEIDTFNDMLSAKLTEKGFGIMDWKDVVQKFRESNVPEEQIYNDVKALMVVGTTTETNKSLTVLPTTEKKSDLESSLTAQSKDGGVSNASSLRVAQMLDAEYIIIASMGKIGHEKRIFKGEGTIYKTNNTADIYTLPLTVKVLDGNSGQSIYGDTLMAADRILKNASIEIIMDNIVDKLLDSGSTKLANNISRKIELIQKAISKTNAKVDFTVECNINGATVELDGTAIGSPPGQFKAKPGLHQLRVTREYFEPWEKTVNVFSNQKLTVSLELSREGLAKYKDITAFKQAQELEKLKTVASVDIAREQSKADASAKEKISSGAEAFLKNSYIRSDGFAEQLKTIIHGR